MNGWQSIALGEAFRTQTGNTPPKSNARFYGSVIPLVKPPELRDALFDSAEDGLSEAGAAVARVLPPKSILVSCIGNLGKIGINVVPVAFNQQINAILPDKTKAVPEFMFYQALSGRFKEQLDAMASGTTVPIVNKSKFNSIEIVLPPLSEQKRIVGVLDVAFEGIAVAKANAEKNLQNARELFNSYLDSVFTRHGPNWTEKTLSEVVAANCTLSYGIVQPGDETPDGLPIVRPTDLTQRTICLSGLKRIDAEKAAGYSRTTLHGGDLLLCVRGTTGALSVAAEELAGANVTRGIVPIRFNDSLISAGFGFYLLTSSAVQGQIQAKTYGAALMQINIADLRNLTVRFPGRKEQDATAKILDALHEHAERLESIYQEKISLLDALKRSLLHQAFTGGL